MFNYNKLTIQFLLEVLMPMKVHLMPTTKKIINRAQFFLGSNNKRAKTVVLHIDGLDDSVSVHNMHTGIKAIK